MATLTLLINGTSCGSFVDFVGLIENKIIKTHFKKRYLKDVKTCAER